jgi:hypothetical protein
MQMLKGEMSFRTDPIQEFWLAVLRWSRQPDPSIIAIELQCLSLLQRDFSKIE